MKSTASDVWSIILAGGNGCRMQPFIKQWVGRDIPKQYCSFVGERSLFQHTLERADQFTHQEQTITVISRDHKAFAFPQMAAYSGGAVLMQPRNCDTGPGVFFPLTYLKLLATDATVVIFPSDHFVYPGHRLLHLLSYAVQIINQQPGQLILVGVRPDTPEKEYGWIQPGSLIKKGGPGRLYRVQSFIEKPTESHAKDLMGSGGLWNTMILAGRLTTFWNLGWIFLPQIMQKFRALQAFIGSQWEHSMLEHIYRNMPVCNLSRGLLQKIPEHLTVLEMSNVLWSDWGQPTRIVETLQAIGKPPNFVSDDLNGFFSKPLGATSLPSSQQS